MGSTLKSVEKMPVAPTGDDAAPASPLCRRQRATTITPEECREHEAVAERPVAGGGSSIDAVWSNPSASSLTIGGRRVYDCVFEDK